MRAPTPDAPGGKGSLSLRGARGRALVGTYVPRTRAVVVSGRAASLVLSEYNTKWSNDHVHDLVCNFFPLFCTEPAHWVFRKRVQINVQLAVG